ncbi:MAG TPA: DUF3105 domain-containing protein [Actinomycetota bacterium]|nr:DUF3105 domain-containing protein [Actinomycetota bacterium]
MTTHLCPECGTPRPVADQPCATCGAPPVSLTPAAAPRPERRKLGYGLILVAIVGIVFLFNNARRPAEVPQSQAPEAIDDPELIMAAASAGCEPPLVLPSEGADHVNPGAEVQYRTSPPASGPHTITAHTGVHRSPVPYINAMHNLEHGHVLLFYRPGVASDVVTALNELARANDELVIAAPDPNMTPEIAITSWQRQVRCTAAPGTYDASEIDRVARIFIDRFVGKGPEGSLPGRPVATA